MSAESETRPSWDETWMAVADAIALRSHCERAQVGAVIVTSDNRVASVSYNDPPPDEIKTDQTCSSFCPRAQGGPVVPYSACKTIHAEMNGLLRSNFTDIRGGTIYVSSAMCADCVKVVCGSGLARVVHRVDPTQTHRNPDAVEKYLHEHGLSVHRV